MKKTCGRIVSLWLKLKACGITLGYSCYVVTITLKGQLKREQADAIIGRWANTLLSMIKINASVFNQNQVELKPHHRYIIMCNHTSVYDIPLSYLAFPQASIRMLAKKELSRIPFFGRAMRNAGFPFIDRKNRDQAIKDLEHASQMMEDGIVLWIAPEGTRSATGELKPLKKGGFITAIQSKSTIIPLTITGAHKILTKETGQLTLHQDVELHIGKPIDASHYQLCDREKLMHEVEGAFRDVLDKSKVHHFAHNIDIKPVVSETNIH